MFNYDRNRGERDNKCYNNNGAIEDLNLRRLVAWSASEGKLFQTDTVCGMKENCEAVVRAKGWWSIWSEFGWRLGLV